MFVLCYLSCAWVLKWFLLATNFLQCFCFQSIDHPVFTVISSVYGDESQLMQYKPGEHRETRLTRCMARQPHRHCDRTEPCCDESSRISLPGGKRALVGSDYNATWWGGGHFSPPRISGTTGQIYKIRTAFDSPGNSDELKLISLTSGSLMTTQVRSKIKHFIVHGCSMECVITSSKTHFIENSR